MKKLGILLLGLVLLFSSGCQKDKLEGEASVLIGTWNWTASYLVPNHCEEDSLWNFKLRDTVSATSSYSLEFQEKGKLIFRHNDGLIWNKRIVFSEKQKIEDPTFDYRFTILLDNQADDPMVLLVGGDSLLTYDFPKDTDNDCEEMFNYFEMEY